MWGWSPEALADPERRASGLAGCLTLPRQVTLHDSRLWIEPVEELTTLRDAHVARFSGDVRETSPVTLVRDAGTGFDIQMHVVPRRTDRLELDLYAAPYGIERTVAFLDVQTGRVGLDTTASTLSAHARTAVHSAPLDLAPDRPVAVRALGDGSIVEVFVDGLPFTARVYPTREVSRAVRLRAHGGTAHVRADAWAITRSAVRVQPAPRR